MAYTGEVTARPEVREVRRYVGRMLLVIAIGAALMLIAALWAWHRYGRNLDDSTRRAPIPKAPEPALPR